MTVPIASPPQGVARPGSRPMPGIMLCLGAAAGAWGLSRLLPGLSPLIIAVALGIIVANTVKVPEWASPGMAFSAKQLLRAGIVLLGLQLLLSDIIGLGVPMLLVVCCIVAVGLIGTALIGRWLGLSPNAALLIACGFSICGAAAVAGAATVLDPDDKAESDTITAVALVVVFGTIMIPLVPLVAPLLGLDALSAGKWAGGSIHEIAQVVAVGGALGGSALSIAVVVKLARVLLLAPVLMLLGIRQRRLTASPSSEAAHSSAKRPPLVPVFIIGFLGMVLLRSSGLVPAPVLAVAQAVQTGLLAAAMFALGCGIKIRALLKVGARPFILAAISTLLVAGIAYAGIRLAV